MDNLPELNAVEGWADIAPDFNGGVWGAQLWNAMWLWGLFSILEYTEKGRKLDWVYDFSTGYTVIFFRKTFEEKVNELCQQ